MPKLVYDIKAKRPACAILQVVYGGDLGIADLFPVKSWIVGRDGEKIDNLKCYLVTDTQLKVLIKMAEKNYGKEKENA